MEASPQSFEQASADIACENCNTLNPADRKFCSQCSFPIAGTAEEKFESQASHLNHYRSHHRWIHGLIFREDH
jgi:hypothetical protein